jgi:hypothetical protein
MREPAKARAQGMEEGRSSQPSRREPTGMRGKVHVPLAAALAAGALVTVSVGLLERYMLVTPHPIPTFSLFFSNPLYLKAWLGSATLVLSGGQLVTAAGMYGLFRLSPAMPVYQLVHRWSGRVAMALTLPVAFNCLLDLGNYPIDLRVMVHAIFGAFIYGIFVAKFLLIRADRAPGWILPIAGSALFTTILGLWLTSAYWLFTLHGWHL